MINKEEKLILTRKEAEEILNNPNSDFEHYAASLFRVLSSNMKDMELLCLKAALISKQITSVEGANGRTLTDEQCQMILNNPTSDIELFAAKKIKLLEEIINSYKE